MKVSVVTTQPQSQNLPRFPSQASFILLRFCPFADWGRRRGERGGGGGLHSSGISPPSFSFFPFFFNPSLCTTAQERVCREKGRLRPVLQERGRGAEPRRRRTERGEEISWTLFNNCWSKSRREECIPACERGKREGE